MQIPAIWPEDENGNPYGICSMAELIFLSNGQNVEDRLTGDILISGDVNYNTKEQLTGRRWTDGKPIYQKTIIIDNPSSAVDAPYAHGISNFKHLIYANVIYTRSDGIEYAEPLYINNGYCRTFAVNSTTMYISAIGNGFTQVRVTLQYTKTTDTANSPVKTMQLKPMLNYSTEEQIIGTWIDGKPVYQKTFVGRGENDENSRYIPSIFIDDFKDLVYSFGTLKLDGVSILVSNGVYGSFVYNPTNGIEIYQTVSVSKKSYDYYATYQYTKTTDTTTLYISPDASNYTLDEKVVGHWIDGKPLYQKTFTNLSAAVRAGDWCKVVELDNPKSVISCDLYRVGGEGQLVHISIRDFTIGAAGYTNCLTITPFDSYTIVMATIQYTKTTD